MAEIVEFWSEQSGLRNLVRQGDGGGFDIVPRHYKVVSKVGITMKHDGMVEIPQSGRWKIILGLTVIVKKDTEKPTIAQYVGNKKRKKQDLVLEEVPGEKGMQKWVGNFRYNAMFVAGDHIYHELTLEGQKSDLIDLIFYGRYERIGVK